MKFSGENKHKSNKLKETYKTDYVSMLTVGPTHLHDKVCLSITIAILYLYLSLFIDHYN